MSAFISHSRETPVASEMDWAARCVMGTAPADAFLIQERLSPVMSEKDFSEPQIGPRSDRRMAKVVRFRLTFIDGTRLPDDWH